MSHLTNETCEFGNGIERAIVDLSHFHELMKDRMDTDDYEKYITSKPVEGDDLDLFSMDKGDA